MTRVLNVIATLSRGGAARALITAAHASSHASGIEHAIVSLRPADASMSARARDLGFELLDAPGNDRLSAAIEQADIVQLHFYNSPELYELLYSDLPPMRLLVWSHVSGEHAPQVLPPELLAFADRVVASSPLTTELPGLSQLGTIPAVADLDRVRAVERDADTRFTVGYLGTLDFAKLHPDFVAMSMGIAVPAVRILVCGTGGALPTLRRQAAASRGGDRIEFAGYVDDIGAQLARMDVFGYPLAPQNFTTSELVLQEAMAAGVPPVVLGGGGARRAVIDGETGLLADSEGEYRAAIEHLHADPEERLRLGANARDFARRTFSPAAVAGAWAREYEEIMAPRKGARKWPAVPSSGAAAFMQSLGGRAGQFGVSATSNGPEVFAAERAIARSPAILCTGGGGILHYRDHYPGDGHLRLWSGLVLHRQGRSALAAGEFAAALKLGCDDTRVRCYLETAMRDLGQRGTDAPQRVSGELAANVREVLAI